MKKAEVAMPESDLTVLIAAKDEADNIAPLIEKIRRVLPADVRAEILVVDDHSEDDTVARAESAGARVILQERAGYGGAFKDGIRHARGRHVLTMDADFSHDPYFIPAMLAQRESAEVVIASRYVPGGHSENSLFRQALSRILNKVFRRALSLGVYDLSSGFRLYRRDVLDGLTLETNHYDLLEEVLLRVHAAGYRIKEVPFHYRARFKGQSNVRLMKLGYYFLRALIKMWRLRNSCSSADYDDRAFDSPIFLQRYWQRRRYQILRRFSDKPPKLLDVGCGSSRVIQGLPQAVGVDVQMNKLRYLSQHRSRLVRASIYALPFKNGVFDELICSQVIEHIPDHPVLHEEMRRVLRNGGTLILGTPDYSRITWVLLEALYKLVIPGGYMDEHITHFTFKTLRERLLHMGYEVLRYDTVGGGELAFKARKRCNEVDSDRNL